MSKSPILVFWFEHRKDALSWATQVDHFGNNFIAARAYTCLTVFWVQSVSVSHVNFTSTLLLSSHRRRNDHLGRCPPGKRAVWWTKLWILSSSWRAGCWRNSFLHRLRMFRLDAVGFLKASLKYQDKRDLSRAKNWQLFGCGIIIVRITYCPWYFDFRMITAKLYLDPGGHVHTWAAGQLDRMVQYFNLPEKCTCGRMLDIFRNSYKQDLVFHMATLAHMA